MSVYGHSYDRSVACQSRPNGGAGNLLYQVVGEVGGEAAGERRRKNGYSVRCSDDELVYSNYQLGIPGCASSARRPSPVNRAP